MSTSYIAFRRMDEINDDEPAVDWIVEGMVPRSGVTLLVARAGMGKSLLACHIAACVLAGAAVFGTRTAVPGAVAYVDLDMHRPRLTKMRMQAALRGLGKSDAFITTAPCYIAGEQSYLDLCDPLVLDDVLMRLATLPDLALVVLDTFSDTHLGKEQSADDMTDVSRAIVAIAAEQQCGVLVLHHARKSGNTDLEDVRGSTAVTAKADAVFFLRPDRDGEGGATGMTLLQRKARLTPEGSPVTLKLEAEGDLDAGDLHTYRYHATVTAPPGRPPVASTQAMRLLAEMARENPDAHPTEAEQSRYLIDHGISRTTANRVVRGLAQKRISRESGFLGLGFGGTAPLPLSLPDADTTPFPEPPDDLSYPPDTDDDFP